jgi:dTDP-glucose 4,6-dehydratase
MIIVTGGAGFIGSNFILDWYRFKDEEVLNIDSLTYAGNLENLSSLKDNELYKFKHGDIKDPNFIEEILVSFNPRAIINFAAESHVDRSIHSPSEFINTNVLGTFNLLEKTRAYWEKLSDDDKDNFRFIHISTDEVYGSLNETENGFSETHPYKPNSPYSASKASSDHLVRAYNKTYSLPTITTNCSNNYGPFQFPEKLIPLCINNALNGKDIPIYGDGLQIRDWLYVKDHCSAIRTVLEKGQIGNIYNIGGNSELTNIEVVTTICRILDRVRPRNSGSYEDQITYIKDRAGHDRRYCIDASKITNELNWEPENKFDAALEYTIEWYLDNNDWTSRVISGEYKEWIGIQYDRNK